MTEDHSLADDNSILGSEVDSTSGSSQASTDGQHGGAPGSSDPAESSPDSEEDEEDPDAPDPSQIDPQGVPRWKLPKSKKPEDTIPIPQIPLRDGLGQTFHVPNLKIRVRSGLQFQNETSLR